MDNGSANALMLEVLRVLLPYREKLRRSLRLTFWSGTLHGRYAGSAWYADNFWETSTIIACAPEHPTRRRPRGHGHHRGTGDGRAREVAAGRYPRADGEEFNGSRFGRSVTSRSCRLAFPRCSMFVSEQPPVRMPQLEMSPHSWAGLERREAA